jgi:alpha-mannosidase
MIRVDVTCALDAAAAHLALDVRGVDRAGDHRLRLELASGIAGGRVIADAAGWPVERRPLSVPEADRRAEHVVPTAPLHRWVAVDEGDAAVLLVSDGLAEYEARDDGRLAITLVRATGELSRAGLPERPGHAGWPARVPGAQGPGPFAARVALAPLGAFDAARAAALADDVLVPLLGHTWRDATPEAPETVPGIVLEGAAHVVPLAVKPAEQGSGLVLRCVNLADAPADVSWRIPWPDARAAVVRLDESPVAADDVRVRLQGDGRPHESTLRLALAPFALASVRVE